MKAPRIRKAVQLLIGALWLGATSAALADIAGFESRQIGPLLRPLKVVSTTGNVQNAEALVEGRAGYTTLTWEGEGVAPQVVLDYGRDVGGIPVFEVISVSGTPQLQAVYSEALPYLLPDGDAAAPGVVQDPAITQPEMSFVGNSGSGDLARLNTYLLRGPGLIVNRLIQGGQRFQAIGLSSPGSVTLRLVGIRSKTFQPPRTVNRGSFSSSDAALNEIWDLGAYTVRLNQVPAGSLPPTWTPTGEGVVVPGNAFSIYYGGRAWTDYTATFQVQVLSNEASWLIRAAPWDGLRFVLAANNAALSTSQPNTLRAYSQFFKIPLGTATLPFDLEPGSWHTVRTVVTGTQASVYLDDQNEPTLEFDFSGVRKFLEPITVGSVGFGNQQGAEARFRNLSVVSATG
jgi:alpha-L-rhamnosidase